MHELIFDEVIVDEDVEAGQCVFLVLGGCGVLGVGEAETFKCCKQDICVLVVILLVFPVLSFVPEGFLSIHCILVMVEPDLTMAIGAPCHDHILQRAEGNRR